MKYTLFLAALIQGTEINCEKCMLAFEKWKLVHFLICRQPLFQKCYSYLEIRHNSQSTAPVALLCDKLVIKS